MINGTANKKVMGETIKDRLLVACEVAFTTELDFDLPAFAHQRDHKGASVYKPLNLNYLGRGRGGVYLAKAPTLA